VDEHRQALADFEQLCADLGTVGVDQELCGPRRQVRRSSKMQKTPDFRGLSDAAEWSRTITGVSTHKALNLARLPVPPQPQNQ
jgi:hypothetical protein